MRVYAARGPFTQMKPSVSDCFRVFVDTKDRSEDDVLELIAYGMGVQVDEIQLVELESVDWDGEDCFSLDVKCGIVGFS